MDEGLWKARRLTCARPVEHSQAVVVDVVVVVVVVLVGELRRWPEELVVAVVLGCCLLVASCMHEMPLVVALVVWS